MVTLRPSVYKEIIGNVIRWNGSLKTDLVNDILK